jgi:hypothetical protein
MLHQIITAVMVLAGITGVALGLYGLAPAFFQKRLSRLSGAADTYDWDAAETYEDDDKDGFSQAYEMLVDTPRRAAGLFGLPGAWAAPPKPVTPSQASDFGLRPEAFSEQPDAPADVGRYDPEGEAEPGAQPQPQLASEASWATEPPSAAIELEVPPELEGVLDIFREVLPDRAQSERARLAAIEGADAANLSIRDLLAEARWTRRIFSRA